MKHRKLLLLLCCIATSLTAAGYDFSMSDGGIKFYYNRKGPDTVEVTGNGSGSYSGTVYIPEKIIYSGTTYTVISIGDSAFGGCPGLTAVTIPNSVTSIGMYAFKGCSGLTEVTIPNSVNIVRTGTFAECSSLKSVFIPNTVTTIGSKAFYKCSSLKSLVIPNSVSSIGSDCFFLCTDLTSVEIPASVTSLGSNAFGSCSNLYKVILMPNTVPDGFGSAFSVLSVRQTYVGNHNYDDHSHILGSINVYTNLSSKFEQGGVIYIPEPISRTVDAIDCDYITTDITIPSEVNYRGVALTVKDIKDHAMRKHSSLTKFTVGGDVLSIGNDAFTGCTKLNHVIFESGSTPISVGRRGASGPLFYDSPVATLSINRDLDYAITPFRNLTSLKSLFVGGQCTQIKSGQFEGCSKIESINVSGAVETIGDDVFKGITTLTDVSLDGNNLSIGKRVFMGCNNLANLVFDSNVANIGDYAFKGCSKIRSALRLGSAVDVTIGNDAFMDCSAITSFTLGNNITSIGSRAFKNCQLISKFNLCDKLAYIGSGAFAGCSTVTSINVPSGITAINDSTFIGCSALSKITLPSGLTYLGAHALNGTAIESLILPEGITEFKDGVVANTPLRSLRITPLIRAIGHGAFDNCTQLADLTIEKSATKLQLGRNGNGEGLFKDCKLDNLSIGRSLTYSENDIDGYSPFYGNTTLKNVTLSDNARTVGAKLFANCTGLESVTLSEDVALFGASAFAGSGVVTINIPSKISIIPANCFENCNRLTTLAIPETVKTIESYAFAGSGLKTLSLPPTISIINDHTFYNTRSLESLIIANGTRTIDTYAFAGSGLKALTIPNSVNEVKTAAFDGAFRLADLRIEDGSEALLLANSAETKGLFNNVPLKRVYIGRELNYEKSSGFGYSPFYRNVDIEDVELGDIPAEVFAHEFDGCTGLLNVTLGDAVNKISEYGFAGCSAMETFTVGASITSISDEAFSDCTALTELRSYAPLPPVCGNQSLSDIDKFSCTLYIPNGSSADYRTAEQWNEFFFVEEFDAGVRVSYTEMSQSNATLKAGETVMLSAVAYPESAMLRSVNWSSTNTDVATVTSAGLVTAHRAGITDILATAADGSGVKGVCRLTVVEDDEPGVFRFEVSNTDVYPDVINRVPVRMFNESAITAFQCDLILPAGITLARDAFGDYYIEMGDRASRHQATINETNGIITIAAYHMSNAQIEGFEGVLFYLPLEVTGEERNCTMTMRNIHLSKVGNIDEELTPVSAVLSVQPRYIMGDANGDNKVSVTDFTTVISYIVNSPVANFVFAAADMDGDGRILIADATAVLVKALTGGTHNAPLRMTAYSEQAIDAIKVNDIMIDEYGYGCTSISLSQAHEYIACQMDIEIPAGLNIEDVTIGDSNGRTHDVAFKMVEHNVIRVIACSFNNDYFTADDVINLTFKADNDFDGGNVIIFNAYAVMQAEDSTPEVSLMDAVANAATETSGIDEMGSAQCHIYLDGRRLIINTANDTDVIITDVTGRYWVIKASAGRSIYTFNAPGMYLVNNKKFIIK